MSWRSSGRIYAVVSWLLIALAGLHMVTTWRLTTASTFTRVWFFGAGLAMAQAGALNLLNRRYGGAARGLRWVTRAVNGVMLAFGAVAGTLTGATAGETVVILGLLAALLLLSLAPASEP